ncbi:Transposon TX1 uncharacterized 149 kDa protein [Vitis vinifera]|uniref:Transposon TX1 uncharacterized 149 kDa protein n=1 Tax=Vitis vinifera TaxID=29760 RepID=A0A438HPN4_VITVI|nr:Transposon TX1 uncharacterized 149 kDa protein [Vitis vinifera]
MWQEDKVCVKVLIGFMEEEVHSALRDMNGDKAPGPDGFTGAFWQFCWEFVKEEVMEMFKEFHEHNTFLKSLNATFLVLIPKKGGAEELGDFKPISLLGGLYKLLAKELANRIKNVIGGVIFSDQNAFVSGRQILDASLIANEVIDSWKKEGKKGLIYKLDIEKAYDSVNWQFLMRPAGFFPNSKGLRQGDPLSPYLFIMGMEVLSALLRRAVEGGCITGSASGLRINLAKSEIIPVGEVDEILEMVVELGCKVGQLPSTYLGLPLGAPNKAGYAWDGVEERMRWKLALWKLGKHGKKSTPSQWEKVCVSKEKGGLGLRRIVQLNKALLGKWVWRFARAKDEMWKRVLVAKYGQEEFGWRTKKANRAFGVLEGHLVRGCGAGPEIPSTLQCGCPKKCHYGGIMGLECWPRRLEPKESKNYFGGGFGLVEGGKNGKFGVKDAYGLLTSHSTSLFPKKGIWVENVPSKLAFFVWEATWGGSLLLIGFKREDGKSLTGVIYVVVKRKMLIIFLYIVQWLVCCGDGS